MGNIRRSRGYAFEHGLVERFNGLGDWRARRLGGSSTGLPDIVADGETGLIGPERDPPALARAIRRLADDAELRQRLGRNARARYRIQFAPAASASRLLAVYGALAGPAPRATESTSPRAGVSAP